MRGRLVGLTDRAILRVAGEGSAKFLQGLCSQDTGILATCPAAPAAFFSPKGRVLCDTILVPRGGNEILLDCHSAVSKSLLRLLLRHRLREPLTIEDVSKSHHAVALLPQQALPAEAATPAAADSAAEAEVPQEFFSDPRFSALGHRAVLCADDAATLLQGQTCGLSAYHLWRLCCAVPEGPADLPVDSMLPLHGNLDLLNFVSFNKGCYIGQELTARTKHRGAVRRRFFSVFSTAGGDPEAFLGGLSLPQAAPLPMASLAAEAAAGAPPLQGALAPGASGASESEEHLAARAVRARKLGAEEWTPAGVLHSAAQNVALCLLRCEGNFNSAERFVDAPLPEGTRLAAVDGSPLALRPPPYAFAA
mmetsp:Transcript_692/g.1759  ORF Transcript_692/g.1759 Transcript_692/m.1759 type:complete len:364 (-) Transcript_692:41-1132(-)